MSVLDVSGAVPSEAVVTARPSFGTTVDGFQSWRWAAGLLAIGAQLTALVAALLLFHVEEDQGLLVLTPLLLGGFALHALLPRRWRPACFAMLSLAALFAISGAATGAVVLFAGLALLGVVHLPVPFPARIVALAVLVSGLALARGGVVDVPRPVGLALPIVGSLFMFRLLVYLYDLRHEREPASPWSRLSYFFLLPNFSFLVFPVVDWGAFRRTWYQGEDLAIYQRGVAGMLRGTSHLLAYRVVAYYLTPERDGVHDLLDLAQLLATGYCQLWRISGQFHLAIGILCLFGWNLPRPQLRYFLAKGFADYWRRANVYWRDFMVKLFLYPSFQRLRRAGVRQPLFAAAALVFFATWLLHGWQWFWLLGTVRLGGVDALFWAIFGTAVAITLVAESRRGRQRVDPKTGRACLAHAAGVLATFVATCLLWSLWTSQSLKAWWSLLSRARHGGWRQAALLAALMLLVLAVGWLATWVLRRRSVVAGGTALRPWSWGHAAPVGVAAATLALLGFSPFQVRLPDTATNVLFSLSEARLAGDEVAAEREGYYAELDRAPRLAERHWFYRAKEWRDRRNDPLVLLDGYVQRAIRPSLDTIYQGKSFRSNRWGMRDRDYALEKPAGTFRLAVLGPSDAMGWSVDDEDVFDEVIERRLAAEAGNGGWPRCEIVNFSISDLLPLEQVVVFRERVLRFRPDAVLLVLHQDDERRAAHNLALWRRRGLALPPALAGHVARLGLPPSGPVAPEALAPVAPDLLGWALGSVAASAREHGVAPFVVLFPTLAVPLDEPAIERIRTTATAAGFEVLDLTTLFSADPQRSLYVTPWDKHPGSAAHQRIAAAILAAWQQGAAPWSASSPIDGGERGNR